MKNLLFFTLLVTISVHANSPEKTVKEAAGLIGTKRQLTFVGPRSGEGYFSPDGKEMIFQAEREPGNPFYQIYRLNLSTGKTQRVSTGVGKTTCAWFHPSMTRAMFASTHEDNNFKAQVEAEMKERANPTRRYNWSFDDSFDIFEVGFNSKGEPRKGSLKNLTKTLGYDAEGAYSPDGKSIVFASNRSGFKSGLSDEDKALFAKDPSSQMEIYTMNSDGSGLQRLTTHVGYDGGPFWSADGEWITWRRFHKNGASAEIWRMRKDGSEAKALTSWEAMSWAPFYHPSGDYIVFTSNKLGFHNFELFIVDHLGKNEPVRVSFADGFDGLPVFSPDGEQLSWTHRNDKGESQIYIAPWDDAGARAALGLPPRLPLASELQRGLTPQLGQQIVQFVTAERFAGRLTGSPEEKAFADSLAEWFAQAGFQKLPGLKSYLQPFSFSSGVELGSANSLEWRASETSAAQKANLEKDFYPLSFSQSGAFDKSWGEIAFAGYGLVVKPTTTSAGFDSYKDLDVQNRWVLVFKDIPEDVPNSQRIVFNQVSRLHHKAMLARERGALGLLVVTGPRSSFRSVASNMRMRFDGAFAEAGLPVVFVDDKLADQWVRASTKKSLEQWQKHFDTGDANNTGTLLAGLGLKVQVDLKPITNTGHNILARIPGTQGKRTIILGAHGDHLGRGQAGSSLAIGGEQGQIHPGADDNASGVAVALALAAQIQAKPLKDDVVIAIWSGEEIGLLGANAFLNARTSLLKNPIFAYVNLDMVGRLREQLSVQSVGSATELTELVEGVVAKTGQAVSLGQDPFVPTDAMAFYLKGIPSLHLFTGAHTDYHTPRDTWQTLNYEGLSQVARFTSTLLESLSTQKKLTYQKAESSRQQMPGRSFRIYIGTIPDYSQEKVQGVLISGTTKGSPAEKAGLQAGDIITEMGGTRLKNIYDYVYLLQSLKPNETLDVKLTRGGKPVALKITPVVKE